MSNLISDEQWSQFERDGYVKLGKLLSDDELAALQRRIDAIMLGTARVNYERMLMQIDSDTGRFEDAGVQSKGFKGPTLNYRKIQDLEYDPLFLRYTQHPAFCEACARIYGPETAIASYRAMFMNKPAGKGTWLPWHQDRWSTLDRDPQISVWTALDPATIANGCVQVISGSQRFGVINPDNPSGFLTAEQTERYAPANKVAFLELGAGEVALLHNWLLHASDINHTDISRRAFSVCYMDANTQSRTGDQFARVFGPEALQPDQLEAAAPASIQ